MKELVDEIKRAINEIKADSKMPNHELSSSDYEILFFAALLEESQGSNGS